MSSRIYIFLKKQTRTALFAVVLPMAVTSLWGQDQDVVNSEIVELDPYVVVGQRYANKLAIDAKKNAESISDSIASDDIGKLPDHNVADILKRVAGVNTILDEGEGRYVSIRGLGPEFTTIKLDGMKLSSVAPPWDSIARAAVLEAVPADALETLTVKKTLTADMDGDAIAGTVELKTASAFDRGRNYLSATLAVADYSMTDMPKSDNGLSRRADVSFSTATGENDEFGFSVGANYNFRDSDELKTIRTGYRTLPSGADQAGDYWNYIYGNDRERKGGSLKFEYRPNQKFHSFVSLNHYEQTDDEDKYGHFLLAGGKQAEETQRITGASGRSRYFKHDMNRETTTLMMGSDYEFSDNSAVSIKASISKSEWYQPNDFIQYDWNGPSLNGTFDNSGDLDLYHLDADSSAAFVDPLNYKFSYYQTYLHNSDEDANELKIDWDRTSVNGRYWGFKIGAKYHEKDYLYNYERTTYRFGDHFTEFVEGSDWTAPGMNDTFVFVRKDAFLDSFDPNAPGWSATNQDATSRDYFAGEKVLAAYAMGTVEGENYNLIFGTRFEMTDWDASSYQNGDGGPIVKREGDYGNLLPSVLLNYSLKENLILRFGLSQSIGRPDYKDLGAPERFDPVDGNIQRSNPDLKPRKSTNYDVSLDYYFDDGLGLFSVALFAKDISDEIYRQVEVYSYTEPDTGIVKPDATISQPVNSGDAMVKGFEVILEKSRFAFLPGSLQNLGLSLNWTHTEGEMDLIASNGSVQRPVDNFVNQPTDVYNAAIYYTSRKAEVRVAYNYTDKYYASYNAGNPDLDDRWDSRAQWDMHARYNFGENWTLFVDLSNLTNEKRIHRYGDRRLREIVDFGRSAWIGLTYRR